ncbi:M15 family metallopeptidase [Clostridia bacterium]|nr:M15 family metallopeptidase [Clostridia bacterium]
MKRKIYIVIILLGMLILMSGCEEKPVNDPNPDNPVILDDPELLELQGSVSIETIDITSEGLLIQTENEEYADNLLPLSVIERLFSPITIKASGKDLITFSFDNAIHVDLVCGTDTYYVDGEEKHAAGPSFETFDEEYVNASVLVDILDATETEAGWLLPLTVGETGEMVDVADYRGKLGFLSLINKENGISRDALGHNLINLNKNYPQFNYLKSDMEFNQTAALALNRMITDITNVSGMEKLYLVSTYRSYDYQDSIYKRKIKQYMDNYGYDEEKATLEAGRIVAIPGTSEHQSGLAVDFTGKTLVDQGLYLEQAFLETPSGAWLAEHAPEYGFILRYPGESEERTEIMQEAWHYRYVGEPHSRFITENGMVLEDYVSLLGKTKKQSMNDGDKYLVVYLDEEWTDLVRVDSGFCSVSDSNEGGMIVTIHGW